MVKKSGGKGKGGVIMLVKKYGDEKWQQKKQGEVIAVVKEGGDKLWW